MCEERPKGMIPIEEFSKLKGISSEKLVDMIHNGFYEGRKIKEQWFIENKNGLIFNQNNYFLLIHLFSGLFMLAILILLLYSPFNTSMFFGGLFISGFVLLNFLQVVKRILRNSYIEIKENSLILSNTDLITTYEVIDMKLIDALHIAQIPNEKGKVLLISHNNGMKVNLREKYFNSKGEFSQFIKILSDKTKVIINK